MFNVQRSRSASNVIMITVGLFEIIAQFRHSLHAPTPLHLVKEFRSKSHNDGLPRRLSKSLGFLLLTQKTPFVHVRVRTSYSHPVLLKSVCRALSQSGTGCRWSISYLNWAPSSSNDTNALHNGFSISLIPHSSFRRGYFHLVSHPSIPPPRISSWACP